MKPPGDMGPPPTRSVFRLGHFRYSAIELLVVLLLLFFTIPFVEDLPQGDLVDSVLLTTVMVSAVVAVGGQRRNMIVALVLVIPALACKWANYFRPDLVPATAYLVAAIVFFIFVVARLVWFVLHAPKVDANVLCAGLSGYLMLGLLWIPAYVLISQISPGAFSYTGSCAMKGFDALYFSFITLLCTAGYGDIMPVSRAARVLVIMQSIAGIFYMTVLLARLVAMYSGRKSPD